MTHLPDIHRLLPQSPDAEQGIPCSVLLSPFESLAICVEEIRNMKQLHEYDTPLTDVVEIRYDDIEVGKHALHYFRPRLRAQAQAVQGCVAGSN
jgi:hypothetical protein